MKQAIILSIKPKWLSLIIKGKKTVELRKSMPKCELPIDVYLYCTKDIHSALIVNQQESSVIYADNPYTAIIGGGRLANGFVVAKFTLKEIEDVGFDWQTFMETEGVIRKFNFTDEQLTKLCMSVEEANKYALQNTKKDVQLWHIDDLVIFDEPKKLSDFHPYFPKLERWCHEDNDCDGCPFLISEDEDCKWLKGLSKAPQSWCYVEVGE